MTELDLLGGRPPWCEKPAFFSHGGMLPDKKKGMRKTSSLEQEEMFYLSRKASFPAEGVSPCKRSRPLSSVCLSNVPKEVAMGTVPTSAEESASTKTSMEFSELDDLVNAMELNDTVSIRNFGTQIWLQLLHATVNPPTALTALLLSDKKPPCLLVVPEMGDVDNPRVRSFGNDLAREVTSVLQSYMPDPICIVPVFIERQRLEGLKDRVEETLAKFERLVPFGRWQMTPDKLKDLEKAIAEVLRCSGTKD